MFTDSQYAYAILPTHVAIWKEGGVLTAENKRVKCGLSILKFLEGVQLPKRTAVIHCRPHTKGIQR